jgi:YidC/Oxa1 family membrane protein insertase
MPIVFYHLLLLLPGSGLVLYWVVQNLLSIAQQWHINAHARGGREEVVALPVASDRGDRRRLSR